MIDFFYCLNPAIQSLLACTLGLIGTSIGAASVFIFKKYNKTLLDSFLSLSAGVMIAASFFSLINPAIEMAESLKQTPIIVLLIGILGGTFLLFLGDKFFQKKINKSKRTSLLIFSIVLHNIPEGCVCYVSRIRNIILVKKSIRFCFLILYFVKLLFNEHKLSIISHFCVTKCEVSSPTISLSYLEIV